MKPRFEELKPKTWCGTRMFRVDGVLCLWPDGMGFDPASIHVMAGVDHAQLDGRTKSVWILYAREVKDR